jgi:hypothetical protein
MFYCIRCGHQFDRKNKLLQHYNRQKTCKPIELDIEISILKEVINETNDNLLRQKIQSKRPDIYCKYLENLLKKSLQNGIHLEIPEVYIRLANLEEPPKKYTKAGFSIDKPDNIVRKKQIVICKLCNKRFSSYSARVRHEKQYCSLRNTTDTLTKNQIDTIEDIKDSEETIVNESNIENYIEGIDREELIEFIINDASLIADIKNKLDDRTQLVNRNIQNTTNNNCNNITNKTVNKNSNNNNNTTNVTINNQNIFGEENFDYIRNNTKIRDELGRLADNDPKRFFIKLFRTAFFSKEHPENKTFKMINTKSDLVKILEKLPDKWVYASKTYTYYEKVNQILQFIVNSTHIVTEGSKTEKIIDEFDCDRDTSLLREFNQMEKINYKNTKNEEIKELAKIMNLENSQTDI